MSRLQFAKVRVELLLDLGKNAARGCVEGMRMERWGVAGLTICGRACGKAVAGWRQRGPRVAERLLSVAVRGGIGGGIGLKLRLGAKKCWKV